MDCFGELWKKYRFLSYLSKGCNSKAFLLQNYKNKTLAILKIPTLDKEKSHFFTSSKAWYALQKNALLATSAISGKSSALIVPKILKLTANYCLEEMAFGQELNKTYNEMPLNRQMALPYVFARFFNDMHQLNPQATLQPVRSIVPPYLHPVAAKTLKSFMPKDEFEVLYAAAHALRAPSKDKHFISFIHGDLHSRNVLYDKQGDRLSLIDFGMGGYASVYNDFAPLVPHYTGFDWVFMQRMIDAYNNLPKKTPIYINPQTVKNLQFCTILGFLSRLALPKQQGFCNIQAGGKNWQVCYRRPFGAAFLPQFYYSEMRPVVLDRLGQQDAFAKAGIVNCGKVRLLQSPKKDFSRA